MKLILIWRKPKELMAPNPYQRHTWLLTPKHCEEIGFSVCRDLLGAGTAHSMNSVTMLEACQVICLVEVVSPSSCHGPVRPVRTVRQPLKLQPVLRLAEKLPLKWRWPVQEQGS